MTGAAWVLATEEKALGSSLALARAVGGPVTVVAVGPRALADAAATGGADRVIWVEPSPEQSAEAFASAVAAAIGAEAPRVVVATTAPAARVLLGAAAVRLGAALVGGVVGLRVEGDTVEVERVALDGAVLETLATDLPVAVVVGGGDPAASGLPAVVLPLAEAPTDGAVPGAAPSGLRVVGRTAVGGATGVRDAARVVSVGRGLRSRDDLELVGRLVAALGAELACSMPVADDLGWVPKDRYIGRSGQHIAPRLYLALGISGMPQHLEGVRDAKVVVAVNVDPAAPIFRTADLGIVGDLYEVVPALISALSS